MRVLLTTDSYRPNIDGAAVFVERLVPKIRDRGVEIEVVAPSLTLTSYTAEEMGVRVHHQAAWRPFRTRGMLVTVSPSVKEIAARFQPTVVHINLPYSIGLDALRAARHLGLPVLATNHVVIEGMSWAVPLAKAMGDTVEGAVRRYLLWFYRHCDLVAVPTSEARAMLVGRFHESIPLEVVSNGVDLDLFQPRTPTADSYAEFGLPRKPLVLYAGRLEIEKSMDKWLQMAVAIRREMDVHFAVAGSGTLQGELAEMAGDLGLADNVSFLGALPSHQLSRLHNLATVFAICSTTESQSIATLEALASGLPVVAANACALPRLVQEGRNGFLFPPDDEEEAARRVLHIMRDPRLQQAFARASREIASDHSLDKTADRYVELYRAVANNHPYRKAA